MPGLKELTRFRNELSNLAHEREVVEERGEKYEEFPLPPSISATAPQIDVENLLSTLDEPATPDDLAGFDDMLASLSLDESAPEAFSVPDDLLAGFADEIETGRAEEDSFSLPDFELGSNDIEPLEEIDTFSQSDSPEIIEELPELDEMDFTPNFEMDDLPVTGKPQREIIPPLEDLDGTDLFGETPSLPSLEEDLPTIEMPVVDLFQETKARDDDFSDFTVPDDLNIVESPSEAALPDLDGFDGFSLDEDFLKTGADAGEPGVDEFHIPGFSDFTSGAARPSLSEFPEVAPSSRKAVKKEVPLKISEADFEFFLETLATYPLNLRMAVEEYLSLETGSDIHKMELVHSVIGQTPIRKIAHTLETALDRSIQIPKDYERKTLAEYEREKASLRYIFFNRILPAMVLFTITAVLAACTVYLSYQFIYRPLAAESLYKRGYAHIEDGRYTQSLVLFDEAVRMWNKKHWYFTYAHGYIEKKQYITAELMYTRILDRFRNDKQAGLEYAEMLRTDLRNYTKAVEILKRRLLDYFVNDQDGLMLLGDTYLDWAEEDPSKYEEARKTYAILIELYGSKDPYLARMMRYFIRTDNLAQVLPLKKHFMEKKAKLGAPDLVELSGYLVDKRYTPAPGESEYLRDQIEDVRTLLTRAVKADETSPEAHYNMGRFLIYNYQNELAGSALSESLLRFDYVTSMSPKRVLTQIDAHRLLGELLAENKEFLKAQNMYTRGITLYEEKKANRAVRQDSRVGKLYANYADIDYFISGDLDSALRNYIKATLELNDTSSVRYRIANIKYQKKDYEGALPVFMQIQSEISGDKNLLFSFANTLYRRGDYYAAQGYYERLMEILDAERLRKGVVFPQVRTDHQVFVQNYLRASNNLGVALNRLASRTGDSQKNARALALFAESTRAWDALTRNPETLVRVQGSNLAFMNIQNMTHPRSEFIPEIYVDIPRTLENEKVLQQRIDQ